MRQFRIDDSEKERILNLHESATKRQYLTEQDGKCLPINQVVGIEKFIEGSFNSLKNIMGQNISEVCKSDTFGDITEYTFTQEGNPKLKFIKSASFKIDGDLTPKESGA